MSEAWSKLITIFVLTSLFIVIYCRVMETSILEIIKEIWELVKGAKPVKK